MEGTARTPIGLEKRILEKHNKCKSLTYYKELLEELKPFIFSDFQALDEQREAAQTDKEKHVIIQRKVRRKGDYCRILASAWGELKGYGTITFPDEQNGITKAKLLSDYETEFKSNDTRSITEIASVIKHKLEGAKNRETSDTKRRAFSTACIEYEAYRAYLKENLGRTEFNRLEAVYKQAQTDQSEIRVTARPRTAAQGTGMSIGDRSKEVLADDGKSDASASGTGTHSMAGFGRKRVQDSPPTNERNEATNDKDKGSPSASGTSAGSTRKRVYGSPPGNESYNAIGSKDKAKSPSVDSVTTSTYAPWDDAEPVNEGSPYFDEAFFRDPSRQNFHH